MQFLKNNCNLMAEMTEVTIYLININLYNEVTFVGEFSMPK